jgi:hypothetical protein
MSQNDLTIANQGFASFRSDLNSALQALGSTNSGTSAPSTTFANQLFYDTTNNILKIRNEDNDAFISLFTLDQTNDLISGFTSPITITTADNSDNLTLISTDADASSAPNLNMFRNSASPATDDFLANIKFNGRNNNSQDVQYGEIEVYAHDVTDGSEDGWLNLNVMTGGSNKSYLQLKGGTSPQVIFNEDSNDIDFRVESGTNANMLFVDGGNDAVGIATNSPVSLLTIEKGNVTGAGQWASSAIAIANPTNIGSYSQISFGYTSSTTNASAYIGFLSTNQGTNGFGDLVFGTRSVNSDTQPSERLRVSSTGDVGIGTSAPTASSSGIVLAVETSADENVNLCLNTSHVGQAGIIEARRTGRSNYERFAQINLQNDSDSGILRFFTAGSGNDVAERFRCDEAGNINIGRTSTVLSSFVGIEFNGTTHNGLVLKTTRAGLNSNFLVFSNSSEAVAGFIIQNGTTTVNYTTSSDYRLKENVTYDFDATTRLKQLKPCRFNFIADADTTVDGFLAHEVSHDADGNPLVPEAISGEKDATNEDGKIKPQGIDYGKIVPLLVKTIQELEARITTLEGA